MKVLKRLFNFYLQSSIHVALAVVSLACVTFFNYKVLIDFNMLFFLFFSTITGYNFVKFYGIAKFHHRSLATWLKYIQIFSFFCFVFLCFFAYLLQTKTLLYILGFGVVTFLYAIPFLPKHIFVDSKQNLRSISGLKIYLIALIWSGVTVVLPLIEADYVLNADVVLSLMQRFIFIVVLMLPFEIRDLRYDSLKLSTVPQKIGIKTTKWVGVFLLFVLFLMEFFKDETTHLKLLTLALVCFLTGGFVVGSKIYQGKYYSAFWVEAIPIYWLLLLLMFR
ncbi:hypothetical protein LG651_05500 [Tamlana sp. 62-3]|uniref:Prenyltransferase n=1 Tax=Neotamlana sargassicola TaxID=2883125 RepID=A0A9X1L405_9FLAO|nr:hypothetical protein [Tamlana sargassicola]MCB4807697.1 hypothetical protein [Tamlana sargassicola]